MTNIQCAKTFKQVVCRVRKWIRLGISIALERGAKPQNLSDLGRVWHNAVNLKEAKQWKLDLLANGAVRVELKPEDDRSGVAVIITLERSRADEILGYDVLDEEWLDNPLEPMSESDQMQQEQLAPDRVRFDLGFDEGFAEAERGTVREVGDDSDRAYVDGYVRGVGAWETLGYRPESSHEVWNEAQATLHGWAVPDNQSNPPKIDIKRPLMTRDGVAVHDVTYVGGPDYDFVLIGVLHGESYQWRACGSHALTGESCDTDLVYQDLPREGDLALATATAAVSK